MKTILIIDSNFNHVNDLQRLIKKNFPDYYFYSALTGADGLEKIELNTPDVILIDVILPDIDGIELCKTIKEKPKINRIPVILTGEFKIDTEKRIKALHAGVDAFMLKPIDEFEMVLQINAMLKISVANAQNTSNPDVNKIVNIANEILNKEQLYENLVDEAPDILYVFSTVRGALFWSKRVNDILKYSSADLVKNPFIWYNAIHKNDKIRVDKIIDGIKQGQCFDLEYRIKDKNDDWHWFRDRCISKHKLNDEIIVYGLATDITVQKKNENILTLRLWLNEISKSHTEDEYLKKFLDKVEELTFSEIGFFHFVEENQKDLSLQVWSTSTTKNMCKTNAGKMHYPIENAGVWVDCVHSREAVIHNDYKNLPHKKGLPEGHANVVRELVVPILRDNQIKAIMGVGNKNTDYTKSDVSFVQEIADIAWDILIQKRDSQRFKLIFNLSPEGIFLIDEGGKIEQMNNTVDTYSRINVKNVIGKNIFELQNSLNLHENDILNKIPALIQKKEEGPQNVVLFDENNNAIDAEIYAHFVEVSGRKKILGIVRNVTIVKKTIEKQRRSYNFLLALIENMPGSLWIADQNYNLVQCNSVFNENYKKAFNREIRKGDCLLDLVTEEEVSEWKGYYQRALNGESFILERKRKYAENEMWNEYHFSPIETFSNEIKAVMILSFDITERVKNSRKIVQKEQKLAELNATKDKFFSIIAHDLKSPFNSILGFSDLILESTLNKEYDQIELMSKMLNKAAKQSYELLNNLLEWARTQRGKSDFNPTSFLISDIITSSLNVLSLSANFKNIIIKKFVIDIFVYADYNMLETIIRNLVSNAIKYTHPGGEINVVVTELETGIQIEVADNGVGISIENQAKLFNIGEDISTFGTNNEKGTGLGLILCNEFVKAHKGKIGFKSKPGEGSTFYVVLPKNKN